MCLALSSLLAYSCERVVYLRIGGMFAVLLGGLVLGYLSASRFDLPAYWTKRIMTTVLVSFNWLIALFVIWSMKLSSQIIWLPIAGFCLMLLITAISVILFSRLNLSRKSRLTLILAGALSNTGYTGGAFVCYALFGVAGLGLANIYLLLCLPTFYLVFLPLLKLHELRIKNSDARFSIRDMLDLRCLVIPAIIAAIVLNLTGVKQPAFITEFYIIDIFVYVASSLSFFAIGLQVKLRRLKDYINLYFMLGAVKFILTPVMAFLIIWLLSVTGKNLTGLARNVLIVLSTSPSAVLMVTMSNVFNLDGPLASVLWVVTMAIFVAVVVPVLFLVFT